MQIPASSVETVVGYESKNQKVCKIEGTKAVCELIGTGAGTTTVNAYLKNAKTLEVLSTAEMLVSVEEAAADLVYITGSGGVSSTFSMTKGTNKILSAEIVGEGIVITDQANLVWKSSNPNIVKINGTDAGGNISGSSVYVEALNSGECTITVSHEKANTDMVYHIIVPGVEEATVSLDKNFVTVEKGKTTDIKATIEGGTKSDYQNLVWSIDKVNGTEIATCMGSGQQVTVYAYKAGITTLKCTNSSNGSYDTCQIKVEDPKSFTIDRDVIRLPPGDKNARSFTYKVSPADATIEWVYNSSSVDASSIFSFSDTGPGSDGKGTVTVFGIKEGTSRLSGVSSYGNKANIQIQVAWDYQFSLDMSRMDCKPTESQTFTYTVVPQSAVITFENETDLKDLISCKIYNPDSTGKGTIVITPKKEMSGKTAVFKATNPSFNSTTCSPGSSLGADIGEQSIALNISYPNLNVKLLSVKGDGKFSRMDGQSVVVGDGETTTLAFGFAEDKADGIIKNIKFEWSSDTEYGEGKNDATMIKEVSQNGTTATAKCIALIPDEIEYVYKINWAKKPVYYPNKKTSPTTSVVVDDYKTSFKWIHYCYKYHWVDFGNHNNYNDHWGLINSRYSEQGFSTKKDGVNCDEKRWLIWDADDQSPHRSIANSTYWGLKDAPEEKGKIYSVSAMKEIAWFYVDSESFEKTGNGHDEKTYSDLYGSITTNNLLSETVSAELIAMPESSSTMKSVLIGTIIVEYSHLNDYTKTAKVPVYLEIRNCPK